MKNLILISLLFLTGCNVQPTVTTVTADFRNQRGIYIVAYTPVRNIRKAMEDELAKNLALKTMVAVPSYDDFYDITTSTPQEVISKAKAQKLLAVLVINQVESDGSQGIVKNPRRISPAHPTLQAFYEHSKSQAENVYQQDQEVFAEVNLFILDKDEAKLYWSGTTWTFQADGKGRAIRDFGDTIAKQIATLRNRYR